MKNVALITGASAGLGSEFAKIHASKGGDLVIVARRKDKLEELKSEIVKKYGVEVYIITKDLTSDKAPREVYNELRNNGIEVEFLINNAGFGGAGKFDQMDIETHISMINLNISALTVLTHLFLQDFKKRNSGKILNVSSTASLMPGPGQAVYFATKAFVTYLSNAIAYELKGTNITVTNLMPGATETEFAKVSGLEKTDLFNKTASAFSVALDGYNAMMKGKLDIISGLTFAQKMMFGMLPFTPKKMLLKQISKMQEIKN